MLLTAELKKPGSPTQCPIPLPGEGKEPRPARALPKAAPAHTASRRASDCPQQWDSLGVKAFPCIYIPGLLWDQDNALPLPQELGRASVNGVSAVKSCRRRCTECNSHGINSSDGAAFHHTQHSKTKSKSKYKCKCKCKCKCQACWASLTLCY